jgi:hypothetical protein
MTVTRHDLDRRRFLALTGSTAIALAWPSGAFAGAPFAPSPPRRPATGPRPSRSRRVLAKPIMLGDGDSLEDVDLFVPEDFQWTTVSAAVFARGRGIRLRNVTLTTYADRWQPHWSQPAAGATGRGIDPSMAGLRFDACTDLAIDGLEVSGFPQCGAIFYGTRNASLHDLAGHHCFSIFCFMDYKGGNRGVELEYVRARDTWGPGPGVMPGVGGFPSAKRPGQFSGGDGLPGYFEDSVLRDLDFSGELYAGFKLVASRRVRIERLSSNNFQVQGTQQRHANVNGTTEGSHDIAVEDLIVDKSLCTGEVSNLGNGVQISWHVSRLAVKNFVLRANGQDGHAIQLSGDCQASFEGGLISGFNGKRGPGPAYALELDDHSTVNADFTTVNRFENQQRLVLGGPPQA